MLFSPYKRHANKFNYIPRYYDPVKEAREQRRAELCGERAEDGEHEYRPGQYIRTQREAREARRAGRYRGGYGGILKMAAVACLLMLLICMLYPRLADVFVRARRPAPVRVEQTDDFDPSAPITIVPNDYQE